MKSLYFFRNDFRLFDNELLNKALSNSTKIAFIAQEGEENWGVWRKKFYNESLENLSHKLKRKGHSLIILSKDDISKLKTSSFDCFYSPKISAVYEKEQLTQISQKITIESSFNDRLLDNIPYESINDLPDIYTEFRKKIEKKFIPKKVFHPPSVWPKPIPLPYSEFMHQEYPDPNPQSAFPFLGGEDNAHERLNTFFFSNQHILSYKKTRNGLVGLDYSTKFSPYLALGCISPSEIYRQVERFESEVKANQDTYWIKFELWWREYFRWVYEKYQEKFFFTGGLKSETLDSINNNTLFQSWIEGVTGDDFVDANMIELKETGWMSNRGRQNVASYLVKDLKLPWKWGAEYFEKVLIDYDVFSNWGNWQYVAGVGNDPRPNRYFNTVKQAGMYDPNSEFRKIWLSSRKS